MPWIRIFCVVQVRSNAWSYFRSGDVFLLVRSFRNLVCLLFMCFDVFVNFCYYTGDGIVLIYWESFEEGRRSSQLSLQQSQISRLGLNIHFGVSLREWRPWKQTYRTCNTLLPRLPEWEMNRNDKTLRRITSLINFIILDIELIWISWALTMWTLGELGSSRGNWRNLLHSPARSWYRDDSMNSPYSLPQDRSGATDIC